MPPLSLTQSKYAFATLPIVVKSTPGISMAMPPSLIGAPVAFLPLPRPHFEMPAAPVPTLAVAVLEVPPPNASAAVANARRQAAAQATPIRIFVDRIEFSSCLWLYELGDAAREHGSSAVPDHIKISSGLALLAS